MAELTPFAKHALAGLGLGVLSFIFLIGSQFGILSVIIAVTPVIWFFYKKSVIVKELEENYRIFLDDLKDLLQAGVNITEALEVEARSDYGALNIYVRRIAAQVKIGVPFEKAMNNTFGTIDSPTIRRIVLVISQTLRAGGNFMKVFTTSTAYVEKIERLQNERKARTFSVISNAYMMFIVFVLIVLGIQVFFAPLLENQPSIDLEGMGATSSLDASGSPLTGDKPKVDFSAHFFNLLLVQAIFTGPIIGKISENSVIAGLRHSVILLAVSVSLYIGATSLFGV